MDNKGYTLIEVVVALGIFVTISAIGTGVFMSIVKAQRLTYTTQNAAQELRYLQDVMSRDIREAGKFECTSSSRLEISEVNNSNARVYSWDSTSAERQIMRSAGAAAATPIVTTEVEDFRVTCQNEENFVNVFIRVAGVTDPYQMTVSQRVGE